MCAFCIFGRGLRSLCRTLAVVGECCALWGWHRLVLCGLEGSAWLGCCCAVRSFIGLLDFNYVASTFGFLSVGDAWPRVLLDCTAAGGPFTLAGCVAKGALGLNHC
ncbi:hypothetical protein VNO80_19241 [Phaseolus coccineus]|uniref:Uncharacterized protein n=1 Tax=Phaseolus coccineus TaxID=3886 RepID=A0AAN9MFT1_PHACN